MSSLSEMLMQGGPFMYVILLLAMLGAVVAVVGGGLGLARVRVPALVWLAVPLAVLVAGAVGELLGLRQAVDAVGFASGEMRSPLAHAGTAVAATTTIFAMLVSSLLLGMGAWLAALPAAISPGEDARTTALTAAAGAGIAGLAGLGLLAWAATVGGAALFIGATLVLLCPALLIGGARAGSAEADLARSGEARASVALCVIGAVACANLYVYLSGEALCHEALANAAAEMKMTLLGLGRAQQRFAATAGAAGTLAAIVASLVAIGPLAAAAASGRTAVSVVLALVGLLVFGAAEAGVLHHRALLATWTETGLLGIGETVPDMPLPQDLDGEEGYGEGVRSYDHVVTWPAGGSPDPALPLPAEGDLIAVALSAATSVSAIASQPWRDAPARLDILLAPTWMPEEALGDPLVEPNFLSALPIRWQPAAALDDAALAALHRDAAALVLYEKDGRVVIHQAAKEPVVVPSLRAAADEVRARADASNEIERLVLGPAAWSAQELVGLAITVNKRRWDDDRLGLELLARHTPPATAASGPQVASLSKDDISRVMRRNLSQIRRCYEQELSQDPTLAGKIEVVFSIAESGRIERAAIESSTLESAAVEDCVLTRVRRIRFSPHASGESMEVRYPFVFSPG